MCTGQVVESSVQVCRLFRYKIFLLPKFISFHVFASTCIFVIVPDFFLQSFV